MAKAKEMFEKLAENKRKQTNLKFPLNIETEGTGNIIRFNINIPEGSKYLGGDYQEARDKNTGGKIPSVARQNKAMGSISRRFSKSYVRTTTKIDLYMPPNISATYVADWGQDELGLAGAGADAYFGLGSTFDSWANAENSWKVIKNTLGESMIRTIASAAQAISPVNIESLRKKAFSTIANPYIEVIFNGVQNRTFSFTFKMIPRSAEEQKMIKQIVEEFKFHRSPEVKYSETNQSNYWLFPSEFDISFLHRGIENSWLFKISTCALTNFTINYSPEGQYAAHPDGSPFATEMTLEFTEMEALTKSRIKEGF